MERAERISNNNIFYFMKEHPDLKLQLENGKVVNVVFPENCISSTVLILGGEIKYIQYSTEDGCNTYDSSQDYSYEENLNRLINELGN